MSSSVSDHVPALLLRIPGPDAAEGRLLACGTRKDVPAFLAALEPLSATGPAGEFLRGVTAALLVEIHDAGACFFAWLNAGDETAGPDMDFDAGTGTLIPLHSAIDGRETVSARRRAVLVAFLRHHIASTADGSLRRRLVEGAALGLSRHLGQRGDFAAAKELVAEALGCVAGSIHLRTAYYALTLKTGGQPVPPRFAKFIGEDNGVLIGRICPEPFTRFDVGPSGKVLVCCGHWLPTDIGDILSDSVEDVLNSSRALAIRRSVTDGSFKYCNHLDCGLMVQDTLPHQSEVDHPALRQAIDQKNFHLEKVDQILFAFDRSCNLSCPSCRTERVVEKPSEDVAKVAAVETKLLPLLRGLQVLNINPAGEWLVSKSSRRLLEMVNREDCPDLVIELISNGTLFTPREWERFSNIHGMIRSLRISVDAATKPTFGRLRRLGDFDSFVRNMEFLAGLRRSGAIPQFKFSFTYQIDNFREMKDFVRFSRDLACDFVIFEKLQNLGTFSAGEFTERAVHRPDHPLYEEFVEIIRDPLFAHPAVWHDFELSVCGHAPVPPSERARWAARPLSEV